MVSCYLKFRKYLISFFRIFLFFLIHLRWRWIDPPSGLKMSLCKHILFYSFNLTFVKYFNSQNQIPLNFMDVGIAKIYIMHTYS